MKLVKTFEGVNNFVNNIKEGECTQFSIPLGVAAEIIDLTDYFHIDKLQLREWMLNHSGSDINYSNFEYADCGKEAYLINVQVERRSKIFMEVIDAFNCLEIDGDYYNAYRANNQRYGLNLVDMAKYRYAKHEGQPNFFSKPTQKVIEKWVAWLKGVDEANREEIARVKKAQETARQEIINSGVEYHEIVNGLRVFCGHIFIDVINTESGVSYDYRLNYETLTRTAEGLTGLLAEYAKAPKKEDKKPKAYEVFKALEVVTVEGNEQWSEKAQELITKAQEDDNATVADICKRALNGVTRLSNKQKWCIVYAYMRVS